MIGSSRDGNRVEPVAHAHMHTRLDESLVYCSSVVPPSVCAFGVWPVHACRLKSPPRRRSPAATLRASEGTDSARRHRPHGGSRRPRARCRAASRSFGVRRSARWQAARQLALNRAQPSWRLAPPALCLPVPARLSCLQPRSSPPPCTSRALVVRTGRHWSSIARSPAAAAVRERAARPVETMARSQRSATGSDRKREGGDAQRYMRAHYCLSTKLY